MIVTERTFGQAVKQLKDGVKTVPEIATYEIGIRPLTTLAWIFGIFMSIIVFFSLGIITGIIFTVVWVVCLILLGVYVDMTYYTLLYLTLIEKKKIPGLRL